MTRLIRFQDRSDAGRQLAQRLMHLRVEQPVVLALPRGGVVVGYEVARALQAPLDIIAVRKIGAPQQPEFGIGAVVDGDEPEILLDDRAVRRIGIGREDLRARIEPELHEIRRRERLYRGAEPRVDVRGRTVILVDDGIATGSSVRAALRALRRANPGKLVLATPVAPPQALAALRCECDEVLCLLTPASFRAVGELYDDFEQTSDDEVIDLLRRAREPQRGAPPAAAPA
jgi:putative phosphoribosyl transferase